MTYRTTTVQSINRAAGGIKNAVGFFLIVKTEMTMPGQDLLPKVLRLKQQK